MRNTGALDEATLTEHTNEPEPQAEISEPAPTLQPDAPEPETTALVPTTTEENVIEGEVVVIDPPGSTEDHTPPKQKPYWLLIPFTILLCLVFLNGSLLLPVLTPSATITIIPVEKSVSITTTIQVQGRQLASLTLMQGTTVAATGKRHRNTTRAVGTITFYNGLLSRQSIAAGTILTGRDGVHIITDQAAIIPAGNPPVYGDVTVPAHAVLAGPQGNIPAYDINTACCATSVVAKNTRAFTGGASARDVLIVTRTDINTAVTSLLVPLSQGEDAALQAQLHPGEALVTPACPPHVASDHKPADEATQATVTVSVTCSGIAYVAHKVYAIARQLITSDVTTKLGANYGRIGDIQIANVQARIIDSHQGLTSVVVQVAGTWVYQIAPEMQYHLMHLVAGMNTQQARATLLQFPGIAGAQITVKGGNQTLPQDPKEIRIIVQYRAI
jgi:hypothetical protein